MLRTYKFLIFSILAVQTIYGINLPTLRIPINKNIFENELDRTLPNSCEKGKSLPIWEKDVITESFCRCPNGSYGVTCLEGFDNPCKSGQVYYPVHESLPKNYFIECSQMLPYVMKCAPYTQWNQEILTCDWPRASYRTSKSREKIQKSNKAKSQSTYGSYGSGASTIPVQVPSVNSQTYGNDQSSVSQSQSTYGSYGSGALTIPVHVLSTDRKFSDFDSQQLQQHKNGFLSSSIDSTFKYRIPDDFIPNNNFVANIIDLKKPDNFVNYFHRVIEPRLQAKNSIISNNQKPFSDGISLLRPTLNSHQVSSTQQLFQLDIPFAKSASIDPNCKIPNGVTVGISFTFF